MRPAWLRRSTRCQRLVFFAPSPSEPGGAQRRAQLLADALAGRGWNVLIIGRTAGNSRYLLSRAGPVTVLQVPGFGRQRLGAGCFLVTAVTVGVVTSVRARAFLALQLSSPAVAAGLCGIITRKPFLVMSSTSGALSEASLLRGRAAGAFRRALLMRARAVIAQTQAAASELHDYLPDGRVAVLPNPVVTREALPLSGTPAVAFLGRFSEEKDLMRLLAAWERLVDQRPDARLTLIGAGTAHRSVERELRDSVSRCRRLRETVRFTGWLSDPAAELGSADVFVFPSLSEGMSNALLEACALGRVVVASDIASNAEVLGERYPLLFSAGDEDQLLEALLRALDDEEVRGSCRTQIAHRLELFAPATVAEHLEALILDADRPRHQ